MTCISGKDGFEILVYAITKYINYTIASISMYTFTGLLLNNSFYSVSTTS